MKIILINGKAGSGKDTLASMIKGKMPTKNVLIRGNALSVKKCAEKYFNWNGIKDDKGRKLLIDITNLGYNVDPYLWEKHTEKYAMDHNNLDFLIITDWRYMSTYDYFVSKDYEVTTILRERNFETDLSDALKKDISEQGFDIKYDYIVRNRGGVEELYPLVNLIVNRLCSKEKRND